MRPITHGFSEAAHFGQFESIIAIPESIGGCGALEFLAENRISGNGGGMRGDVSGKAGGGP